MPNDIFIDEIQFILTFRIIFQDMESDFKYLLHPLVNFLTMQLTKKQFKIMFKSLIYYIF